MYTSFTVTFIVFCCCQYEHFDSHFCLNATRALGVIVGLSYKREQPMCFLCLEPVQYFRFINSVCGVPVCRLTLLSQSHFILKFQIDTACNVEQFKKWCLRKFRELSDFLLPEYLFERLCSDA